MVAESFLAYPGLSRWFPARQPESGRLGVGLAGGGADGIAVCVFYLVSDPHRDSDIRFSNSGSSLPLCSFSAFVDTAFSAPDSRDSTASASSTSLFNASARL